MGFSELASILSFAIVLVFVFTVLSLTVSTMVETYAALVRSRARLLRRRIAEIFDDVEERGFADLLFRSPLIRAQSGEHGFPSYLEPSIFADAVLDVVDENERRGVEGMHPALQALAPGGLADPGARNLFRLRLMDFFEKSTARVSGTFKRWTGFRLFVTGLLVAVVFDVNMLKIVQDLWDQRSTLNGLAAEISEMHADLDANGPVDLENNPEVAARLEELFINRSEFGDFNIPVGRTVPWQDCNADEPAEGAICGFGDAWNALISVSAANLFGWLLTALLVVPGAAFWFDTLGRLVSLRATGVSPAREKKPIEP